MLDIHFIREHTQHVRNALAHKGVSFDIDAFLELDAKRLEIMRSVQELRTQQNAFSETIHTLSSDEKNQAIQTMQALKEELKNQESQLAILDTQWRDGMLRIPMIPHPDAPIGPDDSHSVTIKKWGELPKFEFPPRDHIEIMKQLDIVDFERGTKVHGFRGYYLKGDAVLLCFAIWQYALDFWTQRGFNPVLPPVVTRREPLEGCGFLPQGEEDIYQTQDGSFVVGTSEVGLMGMYMNEILDEKDLPIKMLGFSPCYRLEAGSHSRDTKGLIRVHEFYKVEQVVLCENNEETSQSFHAQMNESTELFIQSLGIPYRVIDAATGDMGLGKARMYDIELWVPQENTYREIGSASYLRDFQTRRLGIRYRSSDGTIKYAHSLNCTAIPTPRILVSLIENNQQADGSVTIPEPLVPYMRGKNRIIL